MYTKDSYFLISQINLMIAMPTLIIYFQSLISQKLVGVFKQTSSTFASTMKTLCTKNFVIMGYILTEVNNKVFI